MPLLFDRSALMDKGVWHDAIVRLAVRFREATRLVFLTGAGISTESGIPDFRSTTGLYKTTSEELFSIDSFLADPSRFYSAFATFYSYVLDSPANLGHQAISALERECHKSVEVVTQNIDMLHTVAGSSTVWEIHGSLRRATCMRCGKSYDQDDFKCDMLSGRAPTCSCGGVLKPDVVFYGEGLPEREYAGAQRAMWNAEALFIVGTSLAVYPAAGLPRECPADAPFVVLNLTPTPLDVQATLVYREVLCNTLPFGVAALIESERSGIPLEELPFDHESLTPIIDEWMKFSKPRKL